MLFGKFSEAPAPSRSQSEAVQWKSCVVTITLMRCAPPRRQCSNAAPSPGPRHDVSHAHSSLLLRGGVPRKEFEPFGERGVRQLRGRRTRRCRHGGGVGRVGRAGGDGRLRAESPNESRVSYASCAARVYTGATHLPCIACEASHQTPVPFHPSHPSHALPARRATKHPCRPRGPHCR